MDAISPLDEIYTESTVCTEHLVFVPCRRCLNRSTEPSAVWSDDPDIIKVVRQYQGGDIAMATARFEVKVLLQAAK